MDFDYDQKYEEMKKYIPFLDNMIRKLENMPSSNGRQSQLQKIRSLRTLLLDMNKRMKMTNLLRCEQVLINLYAKVSKKTTFCDFEDPGVDSETAKEKSDLVAVRNKLKCVAMKQEAEVDTLPEIARSSDTAEMCEAGSKEPALFQRRPKKDSQSPSRFSIVSRRDASMMSPSKSTSRRYTRVLVSPESNSRRWVSNEHLNSNKLFSRRSPPRRSPIRKSPTSRSLVRKSPKRSPNRRSPRRHSPFYHKKERKKYSKHFDRTTEKSDLNITLNVPEDSLNSLNPEDILERIITCSDNDVDIATLRELRTQILGELKQTGANDDISDLILKSYKTKKSRAVSKREVEEGELSDSESEAIESIYGSLAVVDKDKNNIRIENDPEKDQSRKIQICLVINTKDTKDNKKIVKDLKNFEESDFELFTECDSKINAVELCGKGESDLCTTDCDNNHTLNKETGDQGEQRSNHNLKDENTDDSSDKKYSQIDDSEKKNVVNTDCTEIDNGEIENGDDVVKSSSLQHTTAPDTKLFKANFYKPLITDESSQAESSDKDPTSVTEDEKKEDKNLTLINTNKVSIKSATQSKLTEDCKNVLSLSKENDLEIPLLNEHSVIKDVVQEDVVSQIDILQALKNEILSECIDIPVPEQNTPPLHQPKLIKVDSAQKITLNRISIEKYKEKASKITHSFKESPLFNSREDIIKKQSIKLTEKECERFNFISNMGFDDFDSNSSNEEGDKGSSVLQDIYGDLYPKSPDLDVSIDTVKESPKIIPAEPVTQLIANPKDVDMRAFIPAVSNDVNLCSTNSIATQENMQLSPLKETRVDKPQNYIDKPRQTLLDPRIRRDIKQAVNIEQSVQQSTNADRTPRSSFAQNITSSMTSNVPQIITPLMTPIMTPNSRAYENTPTRPSFDIDSNNDQIKHVYAPSFPFFELHKSSDNLVTKEYNANWDSEIDTEKRKSRWNDIDDSKQLPKEDKNINQRVKTSHKPKFNEPYKNDKGPLIQRYKIDRREDNLRQDCPRTPMPSFGWADSSNSPVYNRLDSPMTPSNCFGRAECPLTPSHPFGRSDYIKTPNTLGRTDGSVVSNSPFGRLDCPSTPIHPFGQSECPPTPSHPFGQSECPRTPIYSFGRNDFNFTTNQSFGRLEGSSTPSRLFGQVDGSTTPGHTFGRTDFVTKSLSFSKDPRLNKKLDNDQYNQCNDNNRQYYKDHSLKREGSNHSQKKHYDSYSSYRNFDRDHSIGRNDRSTYKSNEQSGRYWRQRDSNAGYTDFNKDTDSRHRDYDNRYDDRYDKRYDNRYDHRNDSRTSYREKDTKYTREKSIGRMVSYDKNMNSPNNYRNFRNEPNSDKNMSVESDCGRSFTIDTSINSTFQDFIQKKGIKIPDSFDTRRKRACSVGRSLVVSNNRALLDTPEINIASSKNVDNNNDNRFTRARSLGRDVSNVIRNKTLTELKDDFRSYKSKFVSKLSKNDANDKNAKPSQTEYKYNIRQKNRHGPEISKDARRYQREKEENWSPYNRDRDLRMRRDAYSKAKSDYKDRTVRDKRTSGIVYSSDNIAKGTILRSGYGVKNYKIPKIKRVETENEEKELKGDDKIKIGDTKELTGKNNSKDKNKFRSGDKESNKNVAKEALMSNEISRLHEPKSSVGNEKRKTRNKEPLLLNSEKQVVINQMEAKDESILLQHVKNPLPSPTITENNNQSNTELNSDFGLDDLEAFSDNIATDPTIVNINALIADLDNDIDTTKNFPSDEVTVESAKSLEISDNIETKSVEGNNKDTIKVCVDTYTNEKEIKENKIVGSIQNNEVLTESNRDIKIDSVKNHANVIEIKQNIITEIIPCTKILTKDENKVSDIKQNINENCVNVSSVMPDTENNITSDSNIHNENKLENPDHKRNLVLNSNESTVTTTHVDEDSSPVVEDENIILNTDEASNDVVSSPDSTINTNEGAVINNDLETGPDSTNEVQGAIISITANEMNTDVTSTNVTSDMINKDIQELNPSFKSVPGIESIGSLLSMLQDKDNIKKLLSILGDTSGNNEKIKKKLEKLSEIVSDDENTNDDEVNNSKELAVDNLKETTEITSAKNNNTESQVNDTITNDSEATNGADQLLKVSAIIETKVDGKAMDTNETTDITGDKDKVNVDIKLTDILDAKCENLENTSIVTETSTDPKNMNNLNEHNNIEADIEPPVTKKIVKKGKGKFIQANKSIRITRTSSANTKNIKNTNEKKPSRELLQLQEDIKEMFLNDNILNTTGIRMCRLAKMVEKNVHKDEPQVLDPKPVVVLKKFKDVEKSDGSGNDKPARKKPGPKPKIKNEQNVNVDEEHNINVQTTVKQKTTHNNKSKSILKHTDSDPYAFESDSLDKSILNESAEADYSSDSESLSLNSSRSFGSNELLAEIKKPKRKRRSTSWQAGIIKTKPKKKKIHSDTTKDNEVQIPKTDIVNPNVDCFTDKLYCFQMNVTVYSCRFCEYSGNEIVYHYKQQHPHIEIPLSRMNPITAKEAIVQSEKLDYQLIDKIPDNKLVCRFCFKEFKKGKNKMERFFWHVVSMHTGEYKHTCTECEKPSNCPLILDIPPPPKDINGHLIGYICKKCNFTQISIENLKRHVIVRHSDEKTEVYKINMAVISKKFLKTLSNQEFVEKQRVTRSSLSNSQKDDSTIDRSDMSGESDDDDEESSLVQRLLDEPSDQKTPFEPKIKSKIMFEGDHAIKESENFDKKDLTYTIKQEKLDDTSETVEENSSVPNKIPEFRKLQNSWKGTGKSQVHANTSDIVKSPHFKIEYNSNGMKEYVCCINGHDSHYKTALLISMKKHIQTKHNDLWEGYCTICKVIVTSQGTHSFKDCLQHMIDKHMDEFPVLETSTETVNKENVADVNSVTNTFNVMSPLPHTVTNPDLTLSIDTSTIYPKIENIVSFGTSNAIVPQSSPTYPVVKKRTQPEKQYKYEEWQAEVMSKKHRVMLETMMARDKLIKVFKCAGRFCSFATDNAEEALHHASTHQRIGGKNALICIYCDFDASENAIDLVMHVFKMHGRCRYSCALCFYRAVAAQLVGAHIERIHREKPKMGLVLRARNLSPVVTEDSSNLLSRQDAVEFYYCGHGHLENDQGDKCKYRTYIADKFIEHLQQNHQAPHPCTICLHKASDPLNLVGHMKSHNFNVYQCTWCVHGADNEADLLTHASICHPNKQPNAYVRVITNKDHLSELRVLPMASCNKIKTPVEDVVSDKVDDPIREAERSLDLEKLIGDIEIVTSTALTQSVPSTSSCDEIENIVQDVSAEIDKNTENDPSADIASANLVQLPDPDSNNRECQDVIVAPKIEPIEQKSTNELDDVIYCLDSDEDESRMTIIDLSNDENVADTNQMSAEGSAPEKHLKINPTLINKCPKCNNVCRTMVGLKKHLMACWLNDLSTQYQCPHCPFPKTLNTISEVEEHYSFNHRAESYICGICKKYFLSMYSLKKHLKYFHLVVNQTVRLSRTQEGNEVYTVTGVKPAKAEEKPEKVTGKRKLSADTPKPRRYGPQDIDKLPITPILDGLVYCSICEFNTKVRLNLVRHLQLHAEQQPVPHSAPVNPVPHLETNEKHFDKMLNLASSSIASRTSDKVRSESSTPVSLLSSETASQYPKFVPDRQRYTCGSKGCSYISLTEDMLRCHWETLHSDTNEFYCVHCPSDQQLNKKWPLSSSLIINHLKMHDSTLYGCTLCPYYHYKRPIVESHVASVHKGGQVVVVRDDSASGTVQAPPSAPTMDLKPWQCGLCEYKSMLRPEVTEHCWKVHQSKMQFKCSYCPFRTSTLENVTKHQTNSHPDSQQDVFYYYYREGSIPDEEDGTPRWMKQKHKTNAPDPEIKTEAVDSSVPTSDVPSVEEPKELAIDLNIVKQEVSDVYIETGEDLSVLELCKIYGRFCEPNGLKYKCSLCRVVNEETEQAMRSHLFEELKYRRWCCGICTYKAFHKDGLKIHMDSEHCRQSPEPIELPPNVNIEKWVKSYLEHQRKFIRINKDKLSRQRLMINKVTAGPSSQRKLAEPASSNEAVAYNKTVLELTFGVFGSPSDMQFACPKCNFKESDEDAMKLHLDNELSKIRWCCNICLTHHQSYHQAQFHCKSVHQDQSARPVEAVRDVNMRAAWVIGVIQMQKQLKKVLTPSPSNVDDEDRSGGDNSLLVVRYEESIPNPEVNLPRNGPLLENDDTRNSKEQDHNKHSCMYCDFSTKYFKTLTSHLYRHYNLKPFSCPQCPAMGHHITVFNHIKKAHPGTSLYPKATVLPKVPPSTFFFEKEKPKPPASLDVSSMVCLNCEKSIPITEMNSHLHDNKVPEFAKSGEIVVKCCICLALRLELKSLQEHHNASHPDIPINYSFYKLHSDTRDTHHCAYCKSHFRYLNDLKSHHNAMHSSQQLKYTTFSYLPGNTLKDGTGKRKSVDFSLLPNSKRIAKKSTTKLPGLKAVARKSTTKLPGGVCSSEFDHNSNDFEDEVSNYGKRPPPLEKYANVTAFMPFCGTTMQFTMQKLSEVINIEPKLIVKDIKDTLFK